MQFSIYGRTYAANRCTPACGSYLDTHNCDKYSEPIRPIICHALVSSCTVEMHLVIFQVHPFYKFTAHKVLNGNVLCYLNIFENIDVYGYMPRDVCMLSMNSQIYAR